MESEESSDGPSGAASPEASVVPPASEPVCLSCSFSLAQDPWGRLVLTDAEGRQHVSVEPVRAFPLSAPQGGVALCDSEGRELLWIDNLETLAPEVRVWLEAELGRREFIPVLCRVVSISTNVEPSEWQVETDRGLTRFMLRSEDDVHRLDDHRALITDSHGVRYLIPDIDGLDASSRRLLERFL
jgi:Domain of unknown function (DUF1854)